MVGDNGRDMERLVVSEIRLSRERNKVRTP